MLFRKAHDSAHLLTFHNPYLGLVTSQMMENPFVMCLCVLNIGRIVGGVSTHDALEYTSNLA